MGPITESPDKEELEHSSTQKKGLGKTQREDEVAYESNRRALEETKAVNISIWLQPPKASENMHICSSSDSPVGAVKAKSLQDCPPEFR